MKILIVSGAFYPHNSPRANRTTELAKELSRKGHDITVVTPLEDGDFSMFFDMNIKVIEVPKKWKLLRNYKSKILNFPVRIINRLLILLLEYPNIELYFRIPGILQDLSEKFDAIISIAVPYPVHFGVNKFLGKNPNFAKSWIADCGDPYTLCQYDTFRKPFYFRYFEKAFCRRCNYISIPIEEAKNSYYPEFHSKITIIPQGFEVDPSTKLYEYKPNSPIKFVYAGAFNPKFRDPRPVLDYLAKINIDFRFYVFTKVKTLVEPYKDILGEKLIIKDYIERTDLIRFMSSCDFLFNFDNGNIEQSPSKLIDYAFAGRPILTINSRNIDYQKLNQFLNFDFSHRHPSIDVEKYNITNVANQFLQLLKS